MEVSIMTGKPGRPTKKQAVERAWEIIRAGCADGGAAAFDIKATLTSIAADKSNSPTARVSACRMLRELEIAESNSAALSAALD
jgi:hypothetical protein